MKTRIHINQHVIKANRKSGDRNPVITVKRGKLNSYAHQVVVDGPCTVVYSPDKPLPCGASVWIETYANVELFNPLGALPAAGCTRTGPRTAGRRD